MSANLTSTRHSSRKRKYGSLIDSAARRFASSRRDTRFVHEAPSPSPTSDGTAEKPPSFIVGIDFGTTMTSIAYYRVRSEPQPPAALRDEIKFVSHWPGAGGNQNRGEVPTEMIYLDEKMHWGYNARKKLKKYQSTNCTINAGTRIIEFIKILLGNDELHLAEPEPTRVQEVRKVLAFLQLSVRDVVKDYITEVLRFVKSYMVQQEDFRGSEDVEISMSVPAGWPMAASWTFQKIIEGAMKTVEFGKLSGVFIINEPEAASAFSLDVMKEASKIGDVTTYKVSQRSPFRLVETATPSGGNYGSTYVNQAMESDMKKLLKPELSDPRQAPDVERKLSSLFRYFEIETKRNFSIEEDSDEIEYLDFDGLKPNPARGFGQDMIIISRKRIAGWFQKTLDGIADLIHRQLLDCWAKKVVSVQKILFFGGYSQSKHFQNMMRLEFPNLRLIYPNDSNGPKREVMANIGILQTEQFNRNLSAHRVLKSSFMEHPQNKKLYIYNTVDWVVHKGRVEWEKFPRKRNHEVIKEGEPWIIKQDVYYNTDLDKVESHYPDEHENNHGSKYLGGLGVDLTWLKKRYGAELKQKGDGGKYYEIHYNLLMELQGRNLKVSIEYPPGTEVRGSTQLILAAYFAPGTD